MPEESSPKELPPSLKKPHYEISKKARQELHDPLGGYSFQ
jgi:hypothetical protein